MTAAITVENLSKHYKLGERHKGYRTLRESLVDAACAPFRRLRPGARGQESGAKSQDFWALKDVSFEVQPGEVVGIIGRNGAGKSTLLKVLSRITEPTAGKIELRGRVGSLLEVGTGFHPELTGRENIYMNGSILGMTRREIAKKFDEIVDFAGIEEFLDTPVKRYSSGMYVRLAFAVAANLEPEILIVDEVLAVGDAEFQRKCLGRMHEIAKSGRTVFFVSHNLAAVENLCSRGLLLSGGEVLLDADARTATHHFVMSGREECAATHGHVELSNHANRRRGSQPLLNALSLSTLDDIPTTTVHTGDPLAITVAMTMPEPSAGFGIAVFVVDHGQRLLMFHSGVNSALYFPACDSGRMRCEIESLPLVPGLYDIDVAVCTAHSVVDYIERAATLQVVETDYFGTGALPKRTQAKFVVPASWSIPELVECSQ